MKRSSRGDTLIEVLFAFAILATIAAFTFTAAIQGYKNAVQAQNQTQATFLAQYYADGLKTYRDSLLWSGNSLTTQTFLDGFTSPTPSIPSLPAMRNLIASGASFCVLTETDSGGLSRWRVEQSEADCNTQVAAQAPNLPESTMQIQFSDPVRFDESTKSFVSDTNNPDKVTATVRIGYDIPNATVRGEVVNTIILTREQ